MKDDKYLRPATLREGDKVAIISPATVVKEEYVSGGAAWLKRHGFEPIVMPHANGPRSGSFASSRESRLEDLLEALHDKEIKAILCARGGYGCQHLIGEIDKEDVRENAKWIIGFSDITALHALWLSSGVMSLHAPMGKHMTLHPDENTEKIAEILYGGSQGEIRIASHPMNVYGEAEGELIGGNLAVLNGLASTPYDILGAETARGKILFVEDIGENIYEIDRILTRLAMTGILNGIAGLIVGQFTEYHEDLNYKDMEEMIRARYEILSARYGFAFPMAFNFAVGHVDNNRPLIEGGGVKLRVDEEGSILGSIPLH